MVDVPSNTDIGSQTTFPKENGAREGPYIEVEYEQDKISLDIPMPEGVVIDEWKIKPLVPPNVSQNNPT